MFELPSSSHEAVEGIHSVLRDKGWKIAVVETAAGGMISANLLSVPGASQVFEEGIIAYNHDAKNRLGCDSSVFIEHGSVSPEGVREMSRAASGLADVILVESSIAGPDGGTLEKPVGLNVVLVTTPLGYHLGVQRLDLDGMNRMQRQEHIAYMTLIELWGELTWG